MQELMKFENGEFGEIRTAVVDGEPWFVASYVCEYFGVTNRNRVMQAVDDDDKGGTQMNTPGGVQVLTTVNEAGLYTLLFALQPTKARGVTAEYIDERMKKIKAFKHWITHEVIPSIRKHGGCMISGKFSNAQTDPRALTYMQTAYAEKQKMLIKLEEEDMIIQSKTEYYDKVLDSKNSFNVTQIAKDYGMSAKSMNKLLEKLRVQYLTDKQWVLYQDYANKGYTKSKTFYDGNGNAHMHTCWTQKGRRFIYEILKANDVIPLNEVQNAGAYDSVDDKI